MANQGWLMGEVGMAQDDPQQTRRWLAALILAGLLLLPSERASAAPPYISPEIGLDAPILERAHGSQTSAAAAWGGGVYLVVWEDDRALAMGLTGAEPRSFAARVTPSGKVLDPSGIPLPTRCHGRLKVAHAKGGFLVVCGSLYGVRVSAAGKVLDPTGFLISSGKGERLDLASDGQDFLVVWKGAGASADILATRISAAGKVLDSAPLVISSGLVTSWVAVAHSDGVYLVVLENTPLRLPNEILGVRVSRAGAVQDTPPLVLVQGPLQKLTPDVAAGGGQFLVVWHVHTTVMAARVTPAGKVLDPAGIKVATADNMRTLPAVAHAGGRFFSVWMDFRNGSKADIYGGRVTAQGKAENPGGLQISRLPTYQDAPAVAGGEGAFLVLWNDNSGGTHDVHGMLVASSGLAKEIPFSISRGANPQRSPVVAHDGKGYLAAWVDARIGAGPTPLQPRVRASRLDRSGRVQPGAGLLVGGTGARVRAPAAAGGQGQTLVAWCETRAGALPTEEVYAVRVSAAGQVLGAPLRIGAGCRPGVAQGGAGSAAQFLVAWLDHQGWVRAVRVTPAGKVLDSGGVALSAQLNSAWVTGPAVAAGVGRFQVIWGDGAMLRGGGLDGGGKALDGPGGRALLPLDRAKLVAWGLGLAHGSGASGGRYLVTLVQTQHTVSGDRHQVLALRLGSAGEPLGSQPLILADSVASGSPRGVPAVAFDGGRFMVSWEHLAVERTDLWGAWVDLAGTLSAAARPLASHASDEITPCLASDGAGGALLAYARTDYSVGFGATRARARLVGSSPFPDGAPCVGDASCRSGSCVDGVCCASACGGGVADDCMACSVKAGAASDGICGPVKAGEVCRAATLPCQVDAACDGVSSACPTNPARPDGTPCPSGICVGGACAEPLDLPDRGCSCRAAGGAAPATMLSLLAALVLVRRLWRWRF